MTGIYRGLHARIRADPRAVVGTSRVRLPAWRKAWIAFRAQRMAKAGAP